MRQFIVIPRDTPGQFASLSPEEMQQLVQRYHGLGLPPPGQREPGGPGDRGRA